MMKGHIIVRSISPFRIPDRYHMTLVGAHEAACTDAKHLGCEEPPFQAFAERLEELGAWRLIGPESDVTFFARPLLD